MSGPPLLLTMMLRNEPQRSLLPFTTSYKRHELDESNVLLALDPPSGLSPYAYCSDYASTRPKCRTRLDLACMELHRLKNIR